LSEPGIAARLSGIIVPVTTPFDEVTGEPAPIPFRDNLRRWIEHPIDGLLLFGSTGEGALLDEDEKQRLMGFARSVVPAGLPLLAGVGVDSVRATVRQAKRVADEGADAVLVHPPAYFGSALSPAAMASYFRDVADASPVPVLLYHIPKFTKVTLEPGLVAELMHHGNIVGIKDSSGDIRRFADYTNACDAGCRLFVGSGALLYTALELGAAGGIVAAGLLVPDWCAEVLAQYRAGNSARAGQVQAKITPIHKEIVAAFGAVGVKAALDELGYAGGPPRPPLRPLPAKDRQLVARVMQEAGLT
jgi:4-hydroxy-2-oxoglutarate aldolase